MNVQTPEQLAQAQITQWCNEYHAKRRIEVAAESRRVLADDERLLAALSAAFRKEPEAWALAFRCIARSAFAGDMVPIQMLMTAAIHEEAEEEVS